jgi:hypothetical protein
MQREIAESVLALMLEYSGKLDESVQLVKDTCTEDEFIDYRRAVGTIMGEMCIDIIWPIYREYPDLDREEEHMKPKM